MESSAAESNPKSEQTPSVESIFQAALGITSPEDREQYVAEACNGDAQARELLRRLLAAHEQVLNDQTEHDFLERPAPGVNVQPNFNREALDAGLAATFGPGTAAVISSSGNSVLRSLSKSMPDVPHVTLHDGADAGTQVEMPGSSEIPKGGPDSRYQLFGEIARGGMGSIIRGRDNDLGRELAIKVLLDDHKSKYEIAQRFVEEAQIGGQLQHPGIAPVYELGQFEDGRPFFSMKLVKGTTLAAILAKRKSPGDEQPKLLGIFEQICQTMAYVHSKGVIHRDLKPANIMVGAFGEVQVMDWGLSKVMSIGGVADEQKSLDKHRDVSVIETRRSVGSDIPGSTGSDTKYGTAMGTPAYMPPEQALGEVDRLDAAADVFGLGAILAEILTGKPAYVAGSITEIVRMAARGKIDPCFERLDASGADPALIQIAKDALMPEPDDRLRDAGELSTRITEYLEGVQERLKQSELSRAKAQTRKNMSLAIAGLLVIGTVVGAGSYIKYEEKVNEAAQAARSLREQTDRANIALSLAKADSAGSGIRSLIETIGASKQVSQDDQVSRMLTHSQLLKLIHMSSGRQLDGGPDFNYVAPFDNDGNKDASKVVLAMNFSPDNRWLVAGNLIWDMTAAVPETTMHPLHEEDVWAVAFDPSSRWVATWGTSGVIHVFDLNDGFRQTDLNGPGGKGDFKHLIFSPAGDWLAASNKERNAVTLWQWSEDGPTQETKTLKTESANWGIELSPDGRWLAARSLDRHTRLWDLSAAISETPQHVLPAHDSQLDWTTTFDPAGHRLATTGDNDEVRLWNLDADSPELAKVFRDPGAELSGVVFTSQSDRAIVLSSLGPIIWNLESERPYETAQRLAGAGQNSWPDSVLIDDRWLVTRNAVIDILQTDASRQRIQLSGSDISTRGEVLPPWCMAVSSDGHWMATGSVSHRFPRLWDLKNIENTRSLVVLGGQKRALFSPDGSELTLSLWYFQQPSIRRYDLTAASESYRPTEIDFGADYHGAYLSLNTRWMMAGDSDGNVHIRDLQNRESPKRQFLADASGRPVTKNAISNDGTWIVTAVDASEIQLWKWDPKQPDQDPVKQGTPLTVDLGLQANEFSLVFSADARWLFASRRGGGTRLFRLVPDRGLVEAGLIPPDKGSIANQTLGSKGRWAVSRGKVPTDNSLWLWDLQSEEPTASPIHLAGHRDKNFEHAGIAFSQDETHLVTGDWSTRALVWDLNAKPESGALEPIHQIDANGGSVYSVAVDPTNTLVACGGPSQLAIWDISGDRPEPHILLNEIDGVIKSLEFHPDPAKKMLVSAGDGDVHLWNMDFEETIDEAIKTLGFDPSEGMLADYQNLSK